MLNLTYPTLKDNLMTILPLNGPAMASSKGHDRLLLLVILRMGYLTILRFGCLTPLYDTSLKLMEVMIALQVFF